jgi:hypothetical protein
MTVEEESPTLGDSNSQVDALRRFVVECDQLHDLERLIGRFNIFDVLKSTHNEIRHSNILAWLLNPEGSHGLGGLFLRRWLMRVLHESEDAPPIDPVSVDSTPFKSVSVRREWHNIDLLVEIETTAGLKWVICIENKVRSGQGGDQLARYRKRVEAAFKTVSSVAYIFLSVSAEPPHDPCFLVATYEQVARVLQLCLDELGSSLGSEPRLLIEHYLAILNERFMDTSQVTDLAQQIYRAHKLAIDTIYENRPDEISELTIATQELINKDASKLALIPQYSSRGYARFVPKSWNTPGNTQNDEWRLVFCEIEFRSKQPTFKMLAGKGASEEWRQLLLDASIKQGFPRLQRKQTYAPVWFNFCSVKIPSPDLNNLVFDEVEQVAEDIWGIVKDKIRSEEFQKIIVTVAKIVAKKPKA